LVKQWEAFPKILINKGSVQTLEGVKIMKETMIKTIKEDIKYMLTELGNMRKIEQDKDLKNKLMENSGLSQDAVGYRVYIKDFRPYRKMVDSLSKLYDSLNQMYKYNMLKGDEEFVEYIVSSLFAESKELHKLMETCKEDYDQYRCLSDAYVKITDKICRIERDMPRDKAIEFDDKGNMNLKEGTIKYPQNYSVEITEDSVGVVNVLSKLYPKMFKYMEGTNLNGDKQINTLWITI